LSRAIFDSLGDDKLGVRKLRHNRFDRAAEGLGCPPTPVTKCDLEAAGLLGVRANLNREFLAIAFNSVLEGLERGVGIVREPICNGRWIDEVRVDLDNSMPPREAFLNFVRPFCTRIDAI
jgi:hypothetical protein